MVDNVVGNSRTVSKIMAWVSIANPLRAHNGQLQLENALKTGGSEVTIKILYSNYCEPDRLKRSTVPEFFNKINRKKTETRL